MASKFQILAVLKIFDIHEYSFIVKGFVDLKEKAVSI